MVWQVTQTDDEALFPDLVQTSEMVGEKINGNWMSRLVRAERDGRVFYIKTYFSRGRGLRSVMGRSRIRAEWENLQLLRHLQIPTAKLLAFGEQKTADGYRGVMVTEEVKGTADLSKLVGSSCMNDRRWRHRMLIRLAALVRKMHRNRFIHTDLKWRNVLVEQLPDPAVYIIDCPQGRKMSGPRLQRGIVKDLACLDKLGRKVLSKQDRLRFYLAYTGRRHLSVADKNAISRILKFFAGRE